jgi:hypothetical protein
MQSSRVVIGTGATARGVRFNFGSTTWLFKSYQEAHSVAARHLILEALIARASHRSGFRVHQCVKNVVTTREECEISEGGLSFQAHHPKVVIKLPGARVNFRPNSRNTPLFRRRVCLVQKRTPKHQSFRKTRPMVSVTLRLIFQQS